MDKTFEDIVYGEFMDDTDQMIQNVCLVADVIAGLGVYKVSRKAIDCAVPESGLLLNIGKCVIAGSVAWELVFKTLPLTSSHKRSCDRRGKVTERDENGSPVAGRYKFEEDEDE